MERKSIGTPRDFKIHHMASRFAIRMFYESKSFPMEARYSLTDHICRSSRPVSASLAEAWRRERDEDRLFPITLI